MNCLTFELEEHFQVSQFDSPMRRRHWDQFQSRIETNTTRVAELLAEYQTRATFFVLGWVANRHPSLVRRIASLGHEIACHGYAHELVGAQTPALFREDVRKAKRVLEDVTAAPVRGYRAPSLSITRETPWAFPILVEEGFTYDSSLRHTFGVGMQPSGLRQWPLRIETGAGPIWELPPTALRLGRLRLPLASGAWFRTLPYPWLRKYLLQTVTQARGLVVSLHLWELDPLQPRMQGSLRARLRQYLNLERTERQLRRLLRDFTFRPMRDTVDLIDFGADSSQRTDEAEVNDAAGVETPFHLSAPTSRPNS